MNREEELKESITRQAKNPDWFLGRGGHSDINLFLPHFCHSMCAMVSQWFSPLPLFLALSLSLSAACFWLYHTLHLFFPSSPFSFPTTHSPHLSLALPQLPSHVALFNPISCRDQLEKGERNHSPPPKSLMAAGVLAWSFLFTSILGLHTVCSLGQYPSQSPPFLSFSIFNIQFFCARHKLQVKLLISHSSQSLTVSSVDAYWEKTDSSLYWVQEYVCSS